jgi:hypothetical protein
VVWLPVVLALLEVVVSPDVATETVLEHSFDTSVEAAGEILVDNATLAHPNDPAYIPLAISEGLFRRKMERNVSMKMRHRLREFSVANSHFP